MKRLLLGILVSVSAVAGIEREAYVTPCSSWQYDFEANAYVCRFVDSRIRVYETRDVDQLVRSLESKITQLEARVRKLEGGY